MSKDIRSFLVQANRNLKDVNLTENKSRKKSGIISSEDELQTTSTQLKKIKIKKKKNDNKSKKRVIESSDEDEVQTVSYIKKKKAKVRDDSNDYDEKLIEINNSTEFLNTKPVKRVNGIKVNKKDSKQTIPILNKNFKCEDDDFDATLNQLDTSQIEDEYLSTIDDQESSCLFHKNDFTNKQPNIDELDSKNKKEILNENNYVKVKEMTNHSNSRLKIDRDSILHKTNNKTNDIDYNEIIEKNVDKRKHNAILYQNYLNRGGPRNPGSKEIPQGSNQCLANLSFLITGVLDSLERNEVQEIIKKYGGKVVHSVTKKLSYIIVGEEAGPSKLAKAETIGIKKITEDDFLDLIRNRPTPVEIKNSTECSKLDKNKEKNLLEHNNKSPENIKNKKYLVQKESIKDIKEKEISKYNEKNIFKSSENTLKNYNLYSKAKSNVEEVSKIEKNVGDLSIKRTVNNSTEIRLKSNEVVSNITLTNHLKNITDDKIDHITALVEKYRPKDLKQIIGQNGEKSNAKKLEYWLTNWYKNHGKNCKNQNQKSKSFRDESGTIYKAALLSGPPGIGKTTTAHLVCVKLGYEILEFNASDTRSKKLLQEDITGILFNKTIKSFLSNGKDKKTVLPKHVLLMDEVDGMVGNEDRGGMQELITFIKSTEIPIICICNDRNSQKMKTLTNYTFDLRFQKPRIEQIRAAMMSMCFKEGIKITPEELTLIIQSTYQDIRQVINHIAILSAKSEIKTENKEKIKYKNFKLNPWDVVRKVFSSEEHKKMNIHDKSDLFFHDYSIAPLFVEENYPIVIPIGSKYELQQKLANCSESLAIGDMIEKTIRNNQAWSLLPTQAYFSSVIPGSEMSGFLHSQINFPSWLGRNSKKTKYDRLLQDVTVNTRLTAGVNKEAINLDYLNILLNSIIRPLVIEGIEGIEKSLNVMNTYHLSRDDLDSLIELTKWPHTRDPMQSIDTKTKTAFTKAYNKTALYNTLTAIKRKHINDNQIEDFIKSDEEEDSDDNTINKLENDKLIKTKPTKIKNNPSQSKRKIKNILKVKKLSNKK